MRPSEGRVQLWYFGVAGFVFLLLLLSVTTVFELQETAPPEFRQVAVGAGGKSDEQLAWAYWDVAVHVVQWKYSPRVQLPADPPGDFRLPPDQAITVRDSSRARTAYWNKLRELWTHADLWGRHLRVDLNWPARTLSSVLGDISRFIRTSI